MPMKEAELVLEGIVSERDDIIR
jgi:hypothetical protein